MSARALIPPTSNHTGGVNTCVADGSVRFVSDTVHTGDLTTPRTATSDNSTGASPYGVWGAFGTPDGNESVGLP